MKTGSMALIVMTTWAEGRNACKSMVDGTSGSPLALSPLEAAMASGELKALPTHAVAHMLLGSINTIIDQEGKESVKFYQINLELVHLESSVKAWIGDKKIKK